jgi:hypothetical protein
MADVLSPSQPKYPHIGVKLVGENGNAWAILARVDEALRKGGVDRTNRSAYMAWAMDGDYDHLLWVTMCTVATDSDDEWDLDCDDD